MVRRNNGRGSFVPSAVDPLLPNHQQKYLLKTARALCSPLLGFSRITLGGPSVPPRLAVLTLEVDHRHSSDSLERDSHGACGQARILIRKRLV